MSIHVAANGNISFFFHASLLLKVLLHLGSRTPRCEKFCEETEWIQGWSVSRPSTATLPAGLCSSGGRAHCLVFLLTELPVSFGSWPFLHLQSVSFPNLALLTHLLFLTYPPHCPLTRTWGMTLSPEGYFRTLSQGP